jgi:competence protein ComEC
MAILSSLSFLIGRPSSLLRILLLVGALLVFINPLVLWVDLGFQLSFFSSFGYNYYLSDNKKYLSLKFLNRTIISQSIIDIISLTLSVQILTAPLLISNFKQFSVIALLSNLLVIWLIPLIMTLSILALIISFVIPPVASLIFLFLDLLLKYVLLVNHLLANTLGAVLIINYWPIYFSILYYLILFFIIKKIKIKNGDI